MVDEGKKKWKGEKKKNEIGNEEKWIKRKEKD